MFFQKKCGNSEHLVAQGADIAWSDADGLQALHWAARRGQTTALEALLEAGANAEGALDCSPLPENIAAGC